LLFLNHKYCVDELIHGVLKLADNVLVIVSCTKKKIWDVDPNAPEYVAAKDAYVGALFKKGVEYATRNGYPYLIISAKYGLLRPTDKIRNYDVKIGDKDSITAETIREQAEKLGITKYQKIIVLVSTKYCEILREALKNTNITIETPLEGYPLGKMIAKLNKMLLQEK